MLYGIHWSRLAVSPSRKGLLMDWRDLKVGDRIRIVEVPGKGIPGYTIHPDTVRVYKMLIRRGRPVRIFMIDEYGSPWYECRFRRKNGKIESHWLIVAHNDTNWVPVQKRSKRKR